MAEQVAVSFVPVAQEYRSLRRRPARAVLLEACERSSPDTVKSLPDIPPGREASLVMNRTDGLLGERLVDLGFTPGVSMRLVRKGPKGSLIAISIRNTMIALRSEEARAILVSV
jgi:ferrous iron transport protein A